MASALSTFNCKDGNDSVKGVLPSDTEKSLVFLQLNNGRAVCRCHELNVYCAVTYVDIPFVCLDTHTLDPHVVALSRCPGE